MQMQESFSDAIAVQPVRADCCGAAWSTVYRPVLFCCSGGCGMVSEYEGSYMLGWFLAKTFLCEFLI